MKKPATAHPGKPHSARQHRRAAWRGRLPGKRRPRFIEAARAEIERALFHRQGAFWAYCRTRAIVPRYGLARCRDRVRQWRSDAAGNAGVVLDVLLTSASTLTGFVGTPRPGGGRYERKTEADIAQLAFGEQGESALRLVRSAVAVLTALGILRPTKQVRRMVDDNEYRSAAGVRFVNLDFLARLTGTAHLLALDRRQAAQQRGQHAAAMQGDAAPAVVARELDAASSVAADPVPTRPPPNGDPPAARRSGQQHIADILDLLK
ncbi:hypothetical protein EAT51_19920 [Pseudoxanthomonas winnipegensis]|uniref:hypothetical protein n=1 Tax=Pseudoxanthomonas winnipegensis TaxID=2480810 RepID=UPI00102D7A4B|nr:hypothetical protein [Pseudoxanthomonas winnipegensis]TAA36407.1 hypothetical protein EAT51_19920 [Pseudoxanthomonas winnipegensis]